jgi:uncharacterized DUF497 family protein
MEIEWDERKRLANIANHRLDFEDAVLVLDSGKVLQLLARPAGEEVRHRALGHV